MGTVIGYGVESEMEGGFLIAEKPSVWGFSLESAARYDTPGEAWTAANRRQSALAVAIEIILEDDGEICWEPLPKPEKAKGGQWIVWMETTPGGRRMYVMKTGRSITLSNARSDAKGYKLKAAAEKLAAKLAEEGSATGVQQLTAEITPIR
ncbi:hypothetical protein SAMN05216588_1483 [Pseudomonas flavescens]|uniref:Uncharacterized protein n=1 Tax=Phytopseudomonas flavescens TaxID=29435 RepID=A0A1G8QTR8_9GAMM|nr:hypothetical protein [Pseudomonas flavescens]SDJ08041.1 hypothetical protein SAMN05216588_1483 [Pseudomonas flavescens]